MANSKTVVWLFKSTPTDPSAKLGFYQCLKAAAESLVSGGFAQWPKIGAYRFNKLNKAPILTGGFASTALSTEEGGTVSVRVIVSAACDTITRYFISVDPSSTAVAGEDYEDDLPDYLDVAAGQTQSPVLTVTTIDRAGAQGIRDLVLKCEEATHFINNTAPVATITINDGI